MSRLVSSILCSQGQVVFGGGGGEAISKIVPVDGDMKLNGVMLLVYQIKAHVLPDALNPPILNRHML